MIRLVLTMELLVLPFLWSSQFKTEFVFPQIMNLTRKVIQVDVIIVLGRMVIHDNMQIKPRDFKAETAIGIFQSSGFFPVN